MPKTTIKTQINYFISYAHKDQKIVEKFLQLFDEHIQGNKKYDFKQWNDKNIIVGEDWHKQIQEAIVGCDLGLLLLSTSFFNSTYIKENELARFIDDKGNAIKNIFPVGIRKFNTATKDMFGLDRNQIFFDKGKFFNECKKLKAEEFVINSIDTLVRKLNSNPKAYPDKINFDNLEDESINLLSNIYKKSHVKVNPKDIIGRSNELDEINIELIKNNRIVSINGMGGLGKTTLASAYVFQSEIEERYNKIIWITESENNENIMYDLAQDIQLLSDFNITAQGKPIDQTFREIITVLNKIQQKPNLIVIDNATKKVEQFINELPHPKWNILLTTREQIDGAYPLNLGFLELPDAIKLFKKHCNTITDESLIEEIVKTFDKHTLTIEILAKTSSQQHYDSQKLKKAFEENIKANIKTNHSGNKIERIMDYISSIFNLNLLSCDEVWLMKQFVCLPPDFHTYDLLIDFINPNASKKELNFSETLNNLVANGWILEEETKFKMHRIIADVFKEKFSIKIEDILILLNTITLKLKPANRVTKNPLTYNPFITNFGKKFLKQVDSKKDPNINALKNNLAITFQDIGDYENACSLLEETLQSNIELYGENHIYTAPNYSNLGLIYKDLGYFDKALSSLTRGKKFTEILYGEFAIETVMVNANLASVLLLLNHNLESKSLYEKNIEIVEKYFFHDKTTLAQNYSGLGNVLQELNEYRKAESFYLKGLQIFKKEYNEEHHLVAINYSYLGSVSTDLKKYKEAKKYFEKALELSIKEFGMNHPHIATNYSNLGSVLIKLKDYDKADVYMKKALELDLVNFGNNHPNTAMSLNNYVSVLIFRKKYEEALKYQEKALEIFEQKFPKNHTTTMQSKESVASLKAFILKNKPQ